MKQPYGKWEIILDWINRGLITSQEQGKRVIDRFVNSEIKSPYVKQADELSKRFEEAHDTKIS